MTFSNIVFQTASTNKESLTTGIDLLKFNKNTVIYVKLTTKTPDIAVFSVIFEQILCLVLIMKVHITNDQKSRGVFNSFITEAVTI